MGADVNWLWTGKKKVEGILSSGFCYHCEIHLYKAIIICSTWRNLGDHYGGGRDAPLYRCGLLAQ